MNDGKESLWRAQKWKLENVHWCVSDGKTVFKVHEHSGTATLRENGLDIICGKPSGKLRDKAFYTHFAYWSSHKNKIIKEDHTGYGSWGDQLQWIHLYHSSHCYDSGNGMEEKVERF